MHDDPELLRRYAEDHSEAAFAELVQRHLGAVYSVVLRRLGGDAPLAEEVTQAVFTDLARKARPLSRRPSIVGWLFVAARFAAAKAVRVRHQQQELVRQATLMEAPPRPDSEDWTELRPLLDEVVQRLGEADREAVLLHFYGRRTYREIGAILHLSENGARMRVARALERLRRSLGRKGIVSTTAALSAALAAQAASTVPSALIAAVSSTAVAAAGAGPVAGASLLFMTITKTQWAGALALVLAGGAALGVSQHLRLLALQQELATSIAVGASDRFQLDSLRKQAAAQASIVSQLRLQLKHAHSGAPAPSVSSQASNFPVVHVADVLRDHPEYAALQAKGIRRMTLRCYARGVAALNLPAAQAARLKALLVEREESSEDAAVAAVQAGIDSNSAAMAAAQADAEMEANQEISELIGPAAAAKVDSLRESRGSSGSTEDAETDMTEAGIAPSVDQQAALAQLIKDLGDSAKNPLASMAGFRTPDPGTWLSPYDQQVLTQAATVLSSAQLAILASARREDNQNEAIMSNYRKPGQPMMITP